MFKKLFINLFFIAFTSIYYSQTTAPTFKSISWLLGSWQKTDSVKNTISAERWTALNDTAFIGIGFALKGKDTVFVERLQIILKNKTMYYVAIVKENKEPTLFKFTRITKNGFVCQNPQHNFPKKIEYNLTNKHLSVFISDTKKKIKFEFDRVN